MSKELKMITEANYNLTVNESSDKKNLYLEGVFASAETKNANGRVYPKKVLEREYNKLMESVKDKTCMGELGHPTDRSEVSLQHAAILIEDMKWEGNDVWGKAKVLDTPMGMTARSIIEGGGKFGVSTRGLGTVSESGYVNDDYNWITVDCCSNASNPSSRFVNGVLEGKTFPVPSDEDDSQIVQPTDEEIKMALKEHEKKIWQVLENIKKSL